MTEPSPLPQKLFVVVTGLPASGKSTLAAAIAIALDLPMLDKDRILESLFETQGVGSSEWRTRLSRAADEQLCEQALASDGAVITSWWRHPGSTGDSGTPVDWLLSLRGQLIEIHCVCRPHIAATRFVGRTRHPGHLDAQRDRDALIASFELQALLGPVGIGRLIEINTETKADIAQTLNAIGAFPRPS